MAAALKWNAARPIAVRVPCSVWRAGGLSLRAGGLRGGLRWFQAGRFQAADIVLDVFEVPLLDLHVSVGPAHCIGEAHGQGDLVVEGDPSSLEALVRDQNFQKQSVFFRRTVADEVLKLRLLLTDYVKEVSDGNTGFRR